MPLCLGKSAKNNLPFYHFFCADEAARVRENKTSRDKASRSSQNEWFKVYDKVDKLWFINSQDMKCKNISNPL